MEEFNAQKERSFEVGMDEFFKAGSANLYNNMKRTYDAYQDLDLSRARQNDYGVEMARIEERKSSAERDKIATQALQNAVETANMVAKQAVRHGDLSIDRQWNVDEVSTLTAKSGVQSDAMIVALAAAVADILDSRK
jgi:hypothetical protein